MQKLSVKISGMHCGSCGKVITMDLEEVEGVKKVKIDEATKLAEIVYDEKQTGEEELLKTIKNSGYEGQLLS